MFLSFPGNIKSHEPCFGNVKSQTKNSQLPLSGLNLAVDKLAKIALVELNVVLLAIGLAQIYNINLFKMPLGHKLFEPHRSIFRHVITSFENNIPRLEQKFKFKDEQKVKNF